MSLGRVEGHGVDPDIEVIDDPGLMLDGGDPQLETAVAVMLEAIANGEVPVRATRPASPDRSSLKAHDVSFCRPCCHSSRLLLFNCLRSRFLSSLGASSEPLRVDVQLPG